MSSYLSLCAIYHNEAFYLREWLEFHLMQGVERFYLYDNGSTDHHREVLAPYCQDGSVTVITWPGKGRQLSAYEHAMAQFGQQSRWMAFIDLDEFLVTAKGNFVEFLRDREQYPAVGLHWKLFGPSGHWMRPKGMVLESYTRRCPMHFKMHLHTKPIVQTKFFHRFTNPHFCMLRSGKRQVNENGRPMEQPFPALASHQYAWINHYLTRSVQEMFKSLRTPRCATGTRRKIRPYYIVSRTAKVADESGLKFISDLAKRLKGLGPMDFRN